MAEDINFLPEQAVEEEQNTSQQKKTNFFSIVSLLVMMGILISLSVYWLFLTISTQNTLFQVDNTEKQISQESRKEIIRRALVDKIDTSGQILSSTTPFSVAIEKITSILSARGIALHDSSLKADSGLTFSMDFSNSADFQAVSDALTNSDLKSVFANVRLFSFKKDSSNLPYTFTVEMKFLSKGIEGVPKKGTTQ
jgi:cytoskeletal protein RodZ